MTMVGSTCWIHVMVSLLMLKSLTTPCPASIPTLKEVPLCPTNWASLQIARKLKKCEGISEIQTCTKPSKFVYHCVPLMDLSKFVEICAPVILSQGKCIGFDTTGEQLQQFEEKSCHNYNPPCPIGYQSWNATAYVQCYELKKKQKEATTDDFLSHLGWIIPISVILILVALVCIYKKRKGSSTMSKEKEDGVMEKLTMNSSTVIHENSSVGPECMELKGDGTMKKSTRNSSTATHGDSSIGPECMELKDDGTMKKSTRNSSTATHGDSSIGPECMGSFASHIRENMSVIFMIGDEETEGFDPQSFKRVIEDYHLQSVEEIFRSNNIDCISTFVKLLEAELEELGLNIGQRKKCLNVIDILKNERRKWVSAADIRVENKIVNSNEERSSSSFT